MRVFGSKNWFRVEHRSDLNTVKLTDSWQKVRNLRSVNLLAEIKKAPKMKRFKC